MSLALARLGDKAFCFVCRVKAPDVCVSETWVTRGSRCNNEGLTLCDSLEVETRDG